MALRQEGPQQEPKPITAGEIRTGLLDTFEIQSDDLFYRVSRTAQAPQQETSVLQAVLDAIKGTLDPSTQIADHPNVKFAQMQRLNLVSDLAVAQARIQVLETSVDYLRNLIDHPVTQQEQAKDIAAIVTEPRQRWVSTCEGCDSRIEITTGFDDDRALEWSSKCPYCDNGNEVLFVSAGAAAVPSSPAQEPITMIYEVMESRAEPGVWTCEAIDIESGDCYKANFYGPDSEQRAREYAAFMMSPVADSPTDKYREALQRIADEDTGGCRCEHDDENCCALTEDYCCPFCIASVALSAPSPSAGATQEIEK